MPWVTYTALVRHIMRTARNGGHRVSHGQLNALVSRFPTRKGRPCGCPLERGECECVIIGLFADESDMKVEEYYIAASGAGNGRLSCM